MSTNNFEYERRRAELLGLPAPDEAAFKEDHLRVAAEDLLEDKEQIGRVSGGLDELNARLETTKKQLTRYQGFRLKVRRFFHHKTKAQPTTFSSEGNLPTTAECSFESSTPVDRAAIHKSSLNLEEYDRQNDKLDSLLAKAERAELSLKRNNKLIKKIINK